MSSHEGGVSYSHLMTPDHLPKNSFLKIDPKHEATAGPLCHLGCFSAVRNGL